MTMEPIPAGFSPSRDANRVKSFVHRWYSTFDAAPDGDPRLMIRMLSPDGLLVRFPGREMTSREQFAAFYSEVSVGLLASAHHVHGVHVARECPGTYAVGVEVLYQRVRREQGCLSDLATVTMKIVEDADGELLIARYEATFVPRS